MADTNEVVEELWARIRVRLSQLSAPEGGWPVESLSTGIQGTLTFASTAYAAVQSSVHQANASNAGKLLRVSPTGTITVPDPEAASDVSPRGWVLSRIQQAIDNYSQQADSPVTSINNKTGDVTLSAADVGARPSGTALSISDTSGLQAALNDKATVTALTSLDNGIPVRIDSAISTSLGPINTTLSSLGGRVGTLETGFSALESKPSGGWVSTDLSEEIRFLLDRVSQATANATASRVVIRNTASTFSVGDPTNNSHPATKSYVDTGLSTKANTSTVTALTTSVNSKASTADLSAVSSDLTALASRVSTAETDLSRKVELGAGGVFPENYIPSLPTSKITGLQDALDSKVSLTDGKLPVSTIPSGIPESSIAGLAGSLAGKADLVSGKIPTSQIPAIATHETYPVASKAAMLALTTAQVQIGDVAIITTTGADQGTYTLVATDPSQESSWIRHQAPPDTVLSVNGKQGTVVLSAADVGARALGSTIAQGDVTGLTTALNDRPLKSYVDTEVAKKTTPSEVTSIAAGLGSNKQPVDLVATSNQLTLSGVRSVDGVLTQVGQRVLLTAQQASSANGIWVVSAGEWTRGSDMPTGSSIIPGTSVVVRLGVDNAQSIWQLTTASPVVVGTGGQQWAKGYAGKDPITYTATNGLQLTGTALSVRLAAASGLIADSAGLRLDPVSAVRKVSLTVPSGSTVATLTHNLGTSDVSVTFIDNASQEMVLVPWTVVNSNAVSCEFANAVTSGAYRAVVVG